MALADHGLHGGIREVEAMIVHEHVDAGRVAPTHLEPVERRERLLDREIGGERAFAGLAAGELGDSPRRAEAVVADGPERISQCNRLGTATLQLVGREVVDLETAVDVSNERVELVEAGRDRGHELRPIDERHQPGEPLEQRIDLGEGSRDGWYVVDRGDGTVEHVDDL